MRISDWSSDVCSSDLDALVVQAIAEIENESKTKVLIIEDEPLISMQLESLVGDLGHAVVGTAATRTQALDIFERSPAGLVLADIQQIGRASCRERVCQYV